MESQPTLRAHVAGEIRAGMARQKKTGRELAALLGISQQAASRRVTGEGPIDLREVAVIAEWLGIDVRDLFKTDDAEAAL